MERWAYRRESEERREAPAPAEAPPALLLALQRSGGNHAVTRALAARRAAEPLPAGVRLPLEAAFGSPFADVRVQRAAPGAAAIGAEALTRGSEIHFAPGRYDPESAAGRELIGHELAHVVQQRQGRVASGTPLSLDRALESEADAHGRRAARGEPTGAPPTTPLTGEPPAAQAKFGFEFQSDNAFVAAEGVPIVGEKQLAFENTAKKFKVEGDEGEDADHFDVEFITEALSTVDEAEVAVKGAAALAQDLAVSGPTARRAQDQTFEGGTWKRAAVIEVGDAQFHAKPQASVGVTLADFPELVEASYGAESKRVFGAAAANIAGSAQWSGASGGNAPSPALSGFLQMVAFYVAMGQRPNPVDALDPDSFPSLGNQVLLGDGPKVRFPLMARTDFHGMFLSLPAEDRGQFEEGLVGDADHPAPNAELEGILGFRLTDPVINGPYRADRDVNDLVDAGQYTIEQRADRGGTMHPVVMRGPTVLDWLLSIVTGKKYKDAREYANKGRDMLSAPVGWGSRAPGATGFPSGPEITAGHVYGMGAYPVDQPATVAPLAIFELRGLSESLKQVMFEGAVAPEDLSVPPSRKWWRAAAAAIEQELAPGIPGVRV